MCGCFDISDFVCFFTFFITAIVSLLFVQYFFVFVDFETEDKIRTNYLFRSGYFLILTFLGCLIFAGVQRRSISLLRWPSRLLVLFLTVGVLFLTGVLWTLDKVHKTPVRDLELKTIKLCLVIVLLVLYLVGVEKLCKQLRLARDGLNYNFVFNVNHAHSEDFRNPSSSLIDAFRAQQEKNLKNSPPRQFNADRNGVNYYMLLLEGASSSASISTEKSQKAYKSICRMARNDPLEGLIAEV